MDPNVIEILKIVAPIAAIVSVSGVAGWVITTWMRIKNGYPLDGSWGQMAYPKTDLESTERIKLLSQENAQLRAELGSIKDRLGNVEKIIVDNPQQLTAQIEALRRPAN